MSLTPQEVFFPDMGDQGRWFKLWASAPADDALQQLSPAYRWAWAVFGLYTKVHGTRGRVLVSMKNAALAGEMGVTVEDLRSVISSFPHMRIEESENPSHGLAVTWDNWHKYQEDTTMAARQRLSRSKKRGEERRRESSPILSPPQPSRASSDSKFIEEVKNNPAYKGIDVEQELHKMDVWLASKAGHGRKKTQRFVLGWLNRIDVALPTGKSQARRLWEEAQREKEAPA